MNAIQRSFYRALQIVPLSSHKCPKCGQPLNHIHRNWFEKRLGIFIPGLQRYACSSPDCSWEGRVVFNQ